MSRNSLDDTEQDVDSLIASVQNEMNSRDSRELGEECEKISSPNDNHSSLSRSTGPAIETEKTLKNETEKKKTSSTSSSDDDVDENDQDNTSEVIVKKRYKSWKNLTGEQIIESKREKRRRDCICEQCGKHFTDPSSFKMHMIRHSGIRNFQCKQCPKRFCQDSLMRLHVRIDHQGERPYACKHCGKTFSHSTPRVIHERRHTNTRPHSCNFCDKTFFSSDSLRNHRLIHTGIRNFFCTICDRKFQRNNQLKAHLRSERHALKKSNMDLSSTSIK